MKAAAMRYADLLENGCFITHHEQDEIAKLLRRLAMTEDEAWNELERKQNKKTQTTKVDWEAVAADQAMTIAILRDDLRQALAQPEQEPVARFNWYEAKFEWLTKYEYYKHHMKPLYLAPPSKPWVSLTDREIEKAIVSTAPSFKPDDVARAIEAALRSKNDCMG